CGRSPPWPTAPAGTCVSAPAVSHRWTVAARGARRSAPCFPARRRVNFTPLPSPDPSPRLQTNMKKAVIETSRGTITAELFDTEVPGTVANFEKLANAKFYDGTRFHRVISNFMIQGGDPLSKEPNNPRVGTGG